MTALLGDKDTLEQELVSAKASVGDLSMVLGEARTELASNAADREFMRGSLESLENQLEIAEKTRLDQCQRIQRLSGETCRNSTAHSPH